MTIIKTNTPNLLGYDLSQLQALLASYQQPPFRAKQILQWIHQKGVCDVEKMHTLPQTLRTQLRENTCIKPPKIIKETVCADGTCKWQIATQGGSVVEMVLIKQEQRRTLCISSQAGCAVGCSFCVTGKQGFSHDLSTAEIIGQLWLVNHTKQDVLSPSITVSNVVFMGMGEPLLNLDAVLTATRLMTGDLSYGLSKRKVTISSSGILPAIEKMCGATQVALAISLHAPDDKLRSQLVPINKKYPISKLLQSCKNYLASLPTKRFITFEYTLIAQVNDSMAQANQLVKLLAHIPCKINIIPYNENNYCDYQKPSAATTAKFADKLLSAGYVTTVRKTKGDDIFAACGQLAGEIQARGAPQAMPIPLIASSKEQISSA